MRSCRSRSYRLDFQSLLDRFRQLYGFFAGCIFLPFMINDIIAPCSAHGARHRRRRGLAIHPGSRQCRTTFA